MPDAAVRQLGPDALRIEVGHLIDGTDAAPIDDAAILIDGRPDRRRRARTAASPPPSTPAATPSRTPPRCPASSTPTSTSRSRATSTRSARWPRRPTISSSPAASSTPSGWSASGVTTAFDCGGRNRTTFAIRDALGEAPPSGPGCCCSGRPVTAKARPLPLAQRRGRGPWAGRHPRDGPPADRGRGRRRHQGDGHRRRHDDRHGLAVRRVHRRGAGGRGATRPTGTAGSSRPTRTACPGIRNATLGGIDGIQHTTMMGEDWKWTFDDEVAAADEASAERWPVRRWARVRASDYEGGLNILDIQPNPGQITTPGDDRQRPAPPRGGREDGPRDRRRRHADRLRRGDPLRDRDLRGDRVRAAGRDPGRDARRRALPRPRRRDGYADARPGRRHPRR